MRDKFLDLYDECFDDIYRYIYFKVGNKWDADDLVSDVFKRAYEKIYTVTGSPKAWLFTMAKNKVTDYYRMKKPLAMDEGMERLLYSDGSELEDGLIKQITLGCLKRSIEKLPEDDQEIIRLKYFANMKYKEISKVVGQKENSLKTRLNRIIKKLRVQIAEYMEG